MRPEISNELLLKVIQAWDPAEVNQWWVDSSGELRWDLDSCWYMRWPNGDLYLPHSDMAEACELVEFLLKDRPDLVPGNWPPDVVRHCYIEWDMAWGCDPFSSESTPEKIVARIKSYEYLKAWKESQEAQEFHVDLGRGRAARSVKVKGTLDLTPGEMVPGTLVPVLPATYDRICPHCNGSKEVTGWYGKESCQACG